jgi:two-component system, sensor histidine kinase and response regulator
MLRIILRNLVVNAIKFSFWNSEVIVRVETCGNYHQLSVADFGIGMESEDAKAIFNSVINSPGVGTAKERGLGIGLSICKELIEKLGGKIWAESEMGNGSTFHLTIPNNI